MNTRAADYFHPAATFFYIAALAVMAMLFFHPFFIALGLAFAILQYLVMCGGRRLLRQLAWSVPLCAVVAAFNPLVNHGGKTLLFYFLGSPVTLEATVYGVTSGGMLLLVFLWFGVYNRLVTPDRFMYLFSRLSPAASLLVTMTQRLIPLFTRQARTIALAQKTLPARKKAGSLAKTGFFSKLEPYFREISILLSWSMEEGLDTADSMKARGYGCAKRSFFSVFRFTGKDALLLILTTAAAGVCAAGYYSSASALFYPRISLRLGFGGKIAVLAYFVLAAALPVIEARWALMWKICGRKAGRRVLYAEAIND